MHFFHLVCLPGKHASSRQKKASASAQPTGSDLLLTTIVSLIGIICHFRCVLFMSMFSPTDCVNRFGGSGDAVVEGAKELGTANL